MDVNDRRMSEALDRHITGNYGEDQFKRFPPEPKRNYEALWYALVDYFDAHDNTEMLELMGEMGEDPKYFVRKVKT